VELKDRSAVCGITLLGKEYEEQLDIIFVELDFAIYIADVVESPLHANYLHSFSFDYELFDHQPDGATYCHSKLQARRRPRSTPTKVHHLPDSRR
jgi:hypothetical protein